MGAANRAPYAIGDGGLPDTTTVYLRCPCCAVLAVPLGLVYAPGDVGGISPDHVVEMTCGVCGADSVTTAAAIVAREAARVCARCRLSLAVPAAADEVVCPGCELHQRGPATLADPQRAAAVDRVRTANLAAVRARLRALRQIPEEESADELPCYMDDPLVDRRSHRLALHHDPDASASTGRRLQFGVCSCGEWVTPSWDTGAIFAAYDQHMSEVQTSVHEQARGGGLVPPDA
ncbi:hypothetical protein [Planosporangium mesophilum]|uniref:Uncharacterized protein n=1 Tax=Planosporangium mesophilum TaxID=689768 RepID=A0A8J3WZT6_9ACTN|nr:hypothetical protein [Planosporangium mesophilum]NJC83124.1 hypothetical protein [Planosporangium mesophilum]GII22537.1 hypothetical protein Pme01_21340 [Planosporangium mesophilum]